MRVILTKYGKLTLPSFSVSTPMRGIFTSESTPQNIINSSRNNKKSLALNNAYKISNLTSNINTRLPNISRVNSISLNPNIKPKKSHREIKYFLLNSNKMSKIPQIFAEKYEQESSHQNKFTSDFNASQSFNSEIWEELNKSMSEYNKSAEPNKNEVYNAYPMSVIIDKERFKKIKEETIKEEIKQKNDINKGVYEYRSPTLNRNNDYYIKNSFNNYSKKEIDSQNVNLITYLNGDKNISKPFFRRVCEYDNNKINKLNQISSKLLNLHSNQKVTQNFIQKKIKGSYARKSSDCKDYLDKMKNTLSQSNDIFNQNEGLLKRLHHKQSFNDFGYKECQDSWFKHDLLRYFHNREPPKNTVIYKEIYEDF